MAVWPVSIQQKLNVASFSETIGETVLRSDNDIGPQKVRRRFTRSVDVLSCSINITFEEYTTFMNFFKTTINGGATAFDFDHPISGVPSQFRFTAPPQIVPLGGRVFQISMAWEKLP